MLPGLRPVGSNLHWREPSSLNLTYFYGFNPWTSSLDIRYKNPGFRLMFSQVEPQTSMSGLDYCRKIKSLNVSRK